MDRRKFSLSLIGAATAALAGCGGGSENRAGLPEPSTPSTPSTPTTPVTPAPPATPELATPTQLPAATSFAQTIAATDGSYSVAPGQANQWDLNGDFSMGDGSHDQFDGAMQLTVQAGGLGILFPSQSYAELTAFGPELGEADGVKSVSFTDDPGFSVTGRTCAVLHPVPDARLQQTLDLSAAAGHGLTLTWTGENRSGWLNLDSPAFLQVVVRDLDGALLSTLYRGIAGATPTGTWGSASLTAFAGQTVVLSFEHCSSFHSRIDSVSVRDAADGAEFVTNGDFAAGATGWTVPPLRVAQNVTSGVRTLHGLQVRRSFFTQPNARWGRWTDEFANPGTTEISVVAIQTVNLGSDGDGVIYPTPGAAGKALTAWDAFASDRDFGVVFGAAQTVNYRSTTTMTAEDGSGMLEMEFSLSVPPGGRVSLVNFIVMTGTATGKTAADVTARAAEVDGVAADIANNFRTQVAYQRGMTQAQLDSLKNF